MSSNKIKWSSWPLLVPALALLAGILLVPLADTFIRSVSAPGTYTNLFTDGVTMTVLWRTAMTAATVTVAALLIGYPYAYLMTRVSPRARGILLVIVLIPFWTSVMARNFAWIIILQDGGPVQSLFAFFGAERRRPLRQHRRRDDRDDPGDAAVHGAAAVQRPRRHRPAAAARRARARLLADRRRSGRSSGRCRAAG